MPTRSSKFLIGLFVIIGALICAGVIIWVGAAKFFTKGALYNVYFDESVQGLQVDSAIKYRGVEIGKVQKIDVAPDYRLIEVTMKIDLEGDLQKQTIASPKPQASPALSLSNWTGSSPTNWPIPPGFPLSRTTRSFRRAARKSAN